MTPQAPSHCTISTSLLKVKSGWDMAPEGTTGEGGTNLELLQPALPGEPGTLAPPWPDNSGPCLAAGRGAGVPAPGVSGREWHPPPTPPLVYCPFTLHPCY